MEVESQELKQMASAEVRVGHLTYVTVVRLTRFRDSILCTTVMQQEHCCGELGNASAHANIARAAPPTVRPLRVRVYCHLNAARALPVHAVRKLPVNVSLPARRRHGALRIELEGSFRMQNKCTAVAAPMQCTPLLHDTCACTALAACWQAALPYQAEVSRSSGPHFRD